MLIHHHRSILSNPGASYDKNIVLSNSIVSFVPTKKFSFLLLYTPLSVISRFVFLCRHA